MEPEKRGGSPLDEKFLYRLYLITDSLHFLDFIGCGKTRRSVILSEAKNLSFFDFPVLTIEERFLASLRMTT